MLNRLSTLHFLNPGVLWKTADEIWFPKYDLAKSVCLVSGSPQGLLVTSLLIYLKTQLRHLHEQVEQGRYKPLWFQLWPTAPSLSGERLAMIAHFFFSPETS